MKYCEVFGIEVLLAAQNKITYSKKRRIVEFIVQSECDLGVEASSWKHCLLFLFFSGCITQEEFNKEF